MLFGFVLLFGDDVVGSFWRAGEGEWWKWEGEEVSAVEREIGGDFGYGVALRVMGDFPSGFWRERDGVFRGAVGFNLALFDDHATRW